MKRKTWSEKLRERLVTGKVIREYGPLQGIHSGTFLCLKTSICLTEFKSRPQIVLFVWNLLTYRSFPIPVSAIEKLVRLSEDYDAHVSGETKLKKEPRRTGILNSLQHRIGLGDVLKRYGPIQNRFHYFGKSGMDLYLNQYNGQILMTIKYWGYLVPFSVGCRFYHIKPEYFPIIRQIKADIDSGLLDAGRLNR